MKLIAMTSTTIVLGATSLTACADALTLTTPRGAALEIVAEFPAGTGPFPVLVLAPGQGYGLGHPAIEQTARTLVAHGIAVYRFNWAYFTATSGGRPSSGLKHELEDFQTVLNAARAEPRTDRANLSVGGKSLGSVVAWRAFIADRTLSNALLLTPICSRIPSGKSEPVPEAGENYPGFATELRPIALILGNQDPLCSTALLYGFVSKAVGSVRVNVVGGDHGYEIKTRDGAQAQVATKRNIKTVAQLAANFLAEVSGH